MRAFLSLILVVSVLLPFGASAAVPENLEDATVNIYCVYKSGRKTYSSTGTAVFIDSRGVLLTNAHVVQPFLIEPKSAKSKPTCIVRTGSPAESTYTVSLLYLSAAWSERHVAELKKKTPRGTGEGDFALLYVSGATEGSLPASFPSVTHYYGYSTITEGEKVYAGGYPAESLDFDGVRDDIAFKSDDSTVTAVRSYVRPYAEVLTLSPSDVGSAGVSGGPVVRENGELLGIIAAVESRKKVEERSIRAITLTHVSRVLAEETGTNLVSYLLGDIKKKAEETAASLSSELKKAVTRALTKKR